MGEESGVSNYIPYVLKSVQGNFNQGNITLFGETAGSHIVHVYIAIMHYFQCAGHLLEKLPYYGSRMTFSLALDNILIEGDKLYKSLNCLNVDELPRRQIKLYTI